MPEVKILAFMHALSFPLNAPKKRIECQKLFEVELLQRKMEIRMLQEELNAMKNLQSTNMEFEN